MTQYIDKSAIVAEIERRIKGLKDCHADTVAGYAGEIAGLERLLSFLDTLEVKDPYEQCIQYASVKDGIEAHAETYSFNIESLLFNQLTKEQQALWRKEIEQACISGGECGVEIARDLRYKENIEVKEVDLENEITDYIEKHYHVRYDETLENGSDPLTVFDFEDIARYFFRLGLNARKGE